MVHVIMAKQPSYIIAARQSLLTNQVIILLVLSLRRSEPPQEKWSSQTSLIEDIAVYLADYRNPGCHDIPIVG